MTQHRIKPSVNIPADKTSIPPAQFENSPLPSKDSPHKKAFREILKENDALMRRLAKR